MDHLLAMLPEPKLLLLNQVPCTTKLEFDGKSYEDFPKRILEWGPRATDQWAELFSKPSDDFKSFLQTWRYFGVVGTFIRSEKGTFPGLQSLTRSTVVKNEPRFLYTGKLWDFVEQSQLFDLCRPKSSAKQATLSSLSATFQKAVDLEEAFAEDASGDCSCDLHHANSKFMTLYRYILSSRPKDPLDPEFVDSIGLLLDLIANILSEDEDDAITTFYGLKPFLRDKSTVTRHMKVDGWCPWKLGELWNRFNISALFCILNFGRPDQPPYQYDHQNCTEAQCSFSKVDESTYQTRHESGCDGTCPMITAKEGELYDILERGRLPLIEHQLDGNHFKLKRYCEAVYKNDKYVAISHVWADGLGNPKANGIPKCKFVSLTGMLDVLTSKRKFDSAIEEPFWLDTVCCPFQEGKHQDLAIKQMRKTYHSANEVFVLEAALLRCENEYLTDEEILLRIFASSWMTRLWTYQEGFLAKALYFQFANGPYSIWDGYKRLRHERPKPPLSVDKTASIATRCTIRKVTMSHFRQLWLLKSTTMSMPKIFISCAAAVRFRSTSQAPDEPLCLATLLDRDVVSINRVEADLAKRMEAFWGGFAYSITSEIFFSDWDTLDSDGFRWAPRSLINSSRATGTEHWSTLSRSSGESLCQKTEHGLRVVFSAFAFDRKWTAAFRNVMFICSRKGLWYKVIIRPGGNKNPRQSPYQQCARHGKIIFNPPSNSADPKLWILLYPSDFQVLTSTSDVERLGSVHNVESSTYPALLVYSTATDARNNPVVYKIAIADVEKYRGTMSKRPDAKSDREFAVIEEFDKAWCFG